MDQVDDLQGTNRFTFDLQAGGKSMCITIEDELLWLRYTVQRHRNQVAQVQR
ncbi:hypothetical protein [Massilia timonae]|uniref:hypothetical protein n=1 Tax=Massilia timonae TaxID=47229 RepID=UPI002355A92C|nr:hypothetical protein [Massilia timonae]